MEVGAVKQAFNNEVILLKKKLNQAKIQIIHKLTRKAKQLTERKAPEKLKDKLTRKAESAVKEVLIIKKIKARDIAKFIVTHKEDLKKYLNRPQVDNEKACARLLLHKSMQEKYNFIRVRFSNVPIKDLFMSRQERLKLKKELKEKQKNKKKEKIDKTIKKDEWDVEDINEQSDIIPLKDDDNDMDVVMSDNISEKYDDSDQSENSEKVEDDESDIEEEGDNHEAVSESDNENGNNSEDDNISEIPGKFVKLKMSPESHSLVNKINQEINISKNEIKNATKSLDISTNKKVKDNKNRNLKEKIQQKKFKKAVDDNLVTENKVVDPFFITSSGEHYMSLAEPRLPDEVKEVHKQGNRKLRRAVMFGHELKVKPRNKNNGFKNDRFGNDFRGNNDKFAQNDRKSGFNKRNFNNDINADDRNGKGEFNSKHTKFNENSSRINSEIPKDEKLHPSWEAKKRQSGILPFQGKKIVFDES